MTRKVPESIEPDSEQELLERLSMSEQEYKDLKNIRALMSRVLAEEGKISRRNTKKDLNKT